MKVGIVEWYDAQTTRKESPPDSCPIMQSIGYVVQFKDRVVVIHLVTPDNDISNGIHTTIPRGCIKQIRYLNDKKKTSSSRG